MLEKEQLCVLLSENYGIHKESIRTLESVVASNEEAELFSGRKRSPIIIVKGCSL